MSQIIDLEEREWDEVMRILATKEVWAVANPLLMRIGEQRQRYRPNGGGPPGPQPPEMRPAREVTP